MEKIFRLWFWVAFLFAGSSSAFAQGAKAEAENGTLGGTVTIQTSLAGYSGTGYTGRFENDGDRITVTFSIQQAANYDIYIGYAAPYREKINIVSINSNTAEMTFPASSGFTEAVFGKAALKAGSNSIAIIKSWGWFLVDYIRIVPNNNPEVTVQLPYKLATPSPLKRAGGYGAI